MMRLLPTCCHTLTTARSMGVCEFFCGQGCVVAHHSIRTLGTQLHCADQVFGGRSLLQPLDPLLAGDVVAVARVKRTLGACSAATCFQSPLVTAFQ